MRLAEEPTDKVLSLDVITMIADKGISPDSKLLTSNVIPFILSTLKKQELSEVVMEKSARTLASVLVVSSIDDRFVEREVWIVFSSSIENSVMEIIALLLAGTGSGKVSY